MAQQQGFWSSMARVQSKKHRGVTLDDISALFQQLSTLLNAGTPLLHALRLSSELSESEPLAKIIKDISNRVAGGDSFHKSASAYPQIFDVSWVQMIRTGEISGQLGKLMVQLNEDIQKSKATRNKVISALIYPVILLGVAFASMFIMLWKVVPTFAEFFKDFGSKLPAITEYVIAMSNFIRDRGLMILSIIGTTGFFLRRYLRTENGKKQFFSMLMSVPVIGEIYIQSSMEKFAGNLSLLMESGTPLLESLRTTQEVFKNDPIYYACIGSIHSSVARGNNLSASLKATGLFTSMVLNMAKIGEESGKLSEVLDQVAKYYQERVETLIERFTGLLEPMIVIGMGVIVAGLLMSIYIPMFQLAGGPGNG